MQFVPFPIVVFVTSTIFTRKTEAATFTSKSVALISYHKDLNLASNAENGYHIANAIGACLCEEAREKAEIYDPVTDSADKSCGYDVTFNGRKKPEKSFNLLQCMGNNGPLFYLKKVKETVECENKDTDEYWRCTGFTKKAAV